MYIDKDKKRFNPYATHVVDGVTYQGNIIHFAEVVAQLGIVEIPDPAAPEDFNQSTYFVMETQEAPYVVYEKKSAGLINAQEQAQLNEVSRAYLAATDWYTLRKVETGEAVPEDILIARQAARDAVVHLDEEV